MTQETSGQQQAAAQPPMVRFYRSTQPLTVYGGPTGYNNPHGLLYIETGEVFDGRFLCDRVRAMLISNGTLYYWPDYLRK